MVAHATPRTVALFEQTTLKSLPLNWKDNGTFFYCIEPDVAGVVQATAENENYRLRPFAFHPNIPTLKNGECSFGLYMHGSPTNAAEGDPAAAFHIPVLLQAALGGLHLGYAAGVASSEGEDPDEIEIDADPGIAAPDFIFAKDTSSGAGQFYRVSAIDAGPPVTLTLDRNLHFTADPGGDDTIHAVIDCYLHQAAVTQHDHANHKTLAMLFQGDHPDDVYECVGVKPSVSIEAITAGEPTRLSFECLVTAFNMESASKTDFGNATPVGEAGVVPGIASSTYFMMAEVGDPLATVPARGSITVTPNVVYDRDTGPNGYEGVHGHVAQLEAATLEVMVDFDNAYNQAFRLGTEYHAMIQVGDGPGAWGIYLPRLSFASEPTRADEGGLTTSSLSFRALENNADPGALTGDDLERHRSPLHILIVA